jgi:heme-degrading monooxygenase HmoA
MKLYQAERFDDAVNSVETIFMTAAREQRGYQGFLLLTDRETQRLVRISLWETEDDLRKSSSSSGYYQSGINAFAGRLVSPPETSTFDVSLRDV